MGFNTNNTNNDSGAGVFLETIKVERAVQLINTPPSWGDNPVDFGVEVFYTVDIPGKSFETSFLVKCKAKPADDVGRPTGYWGDWKIDELWTKSGTDFSPSEDMTISEESMRDLIGRELRILRYRNNKSTPEAMKTSTWDRVEAADGSGDASLRTLFDKEVAKGYPSNYQAGIASESTDPVSKSFDAAPVF